jgi:hypothetical protein
MQAINETSFSLFVFPFRRKVKFRFDLAALKRATVACRMNLGEFYTSEKVTDAQRLFYELYGAFSPNTHHSEKKLKYFAKIYGQMSVSQLEKVKAAKDAANIMSEALRNAMKANSTDEKKNS